MPADPRDPFPYMRWAKKNLGDYAPQNLGMSGIPVLSAKDLPVPREIGWWAPEGEFGDPELRALVASRYGVPPSHVFVSVGSSTANFLVYLSEARGGHVAVETPGYEALLCLPQAVSASVATFRRVEGRGRRIDEASLLAAARPGTRLLVVTDLHNPTGARLAADDLKLLCAHADRLDAAVLVDEVYLELALEPALTAALAHPRVIVTNSLTKSHGLGGLRIGWILAAPERIERIAAWSDLVCPSHPVPSIAVAKTYFPMADRFLARTKALIPARLEQVDRWLKRRGDVSWERPAGAFTGFLRLPHGMDGDALTDHAFRAHGVRVVPGSFFQEKDHVRISYGLPEADLARALDALSRAIDDMAGHA